jgi:hypothetical protein
MKRVLKMAELEGLEQIQFKNSNSVMFPVPAKGGPTNGGGAVAVEEGMETNDRIKTEDFIDAQGATSEKEPFQVGKSRSNLYEKGRAKDVAKNFGQAGLRYTKTGRISKALKGRPDSHTCHCGKVRSRLCLQASLLK